MARRQYDIGLRVNSKSDDRAIKESTKQVERLGRTGDSVSGKMRQWASAAATWIVSIEAVRRVITALGSAIKKAINVEESENLFRVSMGRMAGAATKFSKTLRDELGLNEFEIRKQIGTWQNFLTSMGLTPEKAFEVSKSLTKLAQDIASFYNISVEEAFQKLQSGIAGEVEPLRRLGVTIDDVTIKSVAYKNGIAALGSELTQSQKVQARYLAIMQQTANAQGDLGRTLQSPANLLRVMSARMESLRIAVGQFLIKSLDLTGVLSFWNEVLGKIVAKLPEQEEQQYRSITLITAEVEAKKKQIALERFHAQQQRGNSQAVGMALEKIQQYGAQLAVLEDELRKATAEEKRLQEQEDALRRGRESLLDQGDEIKAKDIFGGFQGGTEFGSPMAAAEQTRREILARMADAQEELAKHDLDVEEALSRDLSRIWGGRLEDFIAMLREMIAQSDTTAEQRIELEKKVAEAEIKLSRHAAQVSYDTKVGILTELGGALVQAFSDSKDAAVAMAIIDAIGGIVRAFHDYPYPWSALVAATVALQAFAQIDKMKQVEIGSGGGGGASVSGGGGASVNVPRAPNDLRGAGSQQSVTNNQTNVQSPTTINIQSTFGSDAVRDYIKADKKLRVATRESGRGQVVRQTATIGRPNR